MHACFNHRWCALSKVMWNHSVYNKIPFFIYCKYILKWWLFKKNPYLLSQTYENQVGLHFNFTSFIFTWWHWPTQRNEYSWATCIIVPGNMTNVNVNRDIAQIYRGKFRRDNGPSISQTKTSESKPHSNGGVLYRVKQSDVSWLREHYHFDGTSQSTTHVNRVPVRVINHSN